MKSNMLTRRVGINLRSSSPKTGTEPRIACLDSRACAFDFHRLRDACQPQDRRTLNRSVRANLNVLFVVGQQASELYVEYVETGRQRWEMQLPLLVRGGCDRAANQRRRTETDHCARKPASLIVLDRSHQRPSQSLSKAEAARQNRQEANENEYGPVPANGPSPTASAVHDRLPCQWCDECSRVRVPHQRRPDRRELSAKRCRAAAS